ncbi:MAG: DMT family transporter [Granulosicoccus sp.]|nr:DMT family transporter [Granulosicoccus sp.]
MPLTKIAVAAGHHPLGLICWQLAISSFLLGALLLIRSERIRLDRSTLIYCLIIALLGTVVPNTFQVLAFRELPAGVMAIVIAFVPIVSLLVALLAGLEQFSWRRFLGVMVGVLSLAILALPDASMPAAGKAPWLLIALIAPVCYAIEGNFVAARAPVHLSPVAVLFAASVVGLTLVFPIVMLAGWSVSMAFPLDDSRLALIGSGIGHVFAYSGYLWLLQRAGAVFASQIAYVVTITGVLAAVLVLGEPYSAVLGIVVGMVLLALTLVRPMKLHR